MSPTYKRWIFHGDAVDLSPFLRSNSRFLGATFSNVSECREENVNLRENIGVRDTMDDEMVEMIHDLHGPMFEECRRESNEQDESDKISGMFPEIEEELYPGCLKFTSFNFLVKLMHIKVLNRWSDKSFDMLLELLNEAFPNGVELPVSYYEAKKRLRDLGMGYETIHVCKFYCALFWKDYASLDKCPHCGESRYRLIDRKGKQIPHKDEMVELKTTSSQEGREPLLEREICDRVLVKRSGHVKGQGWGPRPKNARNEIIQHNTKEANAQIAHLQSIVESQQATIEAILRRLSCQEATSNMERSSEQSNDSQQLW
ncbi:uncharacterized protein E5676_scaffold896G00240 [Cucumis melo var. makuwa]|uniref:Transposase n=1 Tax=Cucumis melo var. makuwa TaxID=1194695 RepID=A0A5D3BL79_CUCMM|nr:uncharacterized protein E5676_scaffold896G00240 [Cucumis melo var. makuwa]